MKLNQVEWMSKYTTLPNTSYGDNMTMCSVHAKPKFILQEICPLRVPVPENRLVVYVHPQSYTKKIDKKVQNKRFSFYDTAKKVVMIEVYYLFLKKVGNVVEGLMRRN